MQVVSFSPSPNSQLCIRLLNCSNRPFLFMSKFAFPIGGRNKSLTWYINRPPEGALAPKCRIPLELEKS